MSAVRRHNAAARRVDPLEALEPRRLLAATLLVVNGTAGNDVIELAQTATAYVVKVNGVTATHLFTNVNKIDVKCGDGDDIVIGSPDLTLGFYADGGNGNDRMIGGQGPDTIGGAAGKDIIYGGLGNDRLNGAGGNDKVLGEAGADRCYGGDGNDYIDGGSSNDRLYLNNGLDTAFGAGGNDVFYAIDRAQDQLFGGSGSDTTTCDNIDIRASVENVAII
jgi:Ca2+-binding RTX toxin-like protein